VPGAVGDTNWTTRVNGGISEWDKMFKKEILTATLALKETGRIVAKKD
jgi:hypothetical protein